MLDKNVILLSAALPDLRIRMINNEDLENLRNWKNSNKHSFFLGKDITPEQQEKWYTGFSGRENDFMFIVEQLVQTEWTSIGCMGFRKLDDEGCVDGYNIIRAKKIEPASFTMSEAIRIMLAYAASVYPQLPIRVKVLSHNPAVAWYKKNEFSIIDTATNYCLMEFNKSTLINIDWSVKQTP